ncbi:MAG: hypothetical protein VB980_00545 [Opitutales bacterium]
MPEPILGVWLEADSLTTAARKTMSEKKILTRGLKESLPDNCRRKVGSKNEILIREKPPSLSGENKEVSGLASEIVSSMQTFDYTEDVSPFSDLAVAAVDDMIKGWENHEMEDLSSSRWPAAKQAELDPRYESRKAAEKAADEFVEKWVEKPFGFLFGAAALVVAVPLGAALAVAASPLIGLLAGGEWACRKLGLHDLETLPAIERKKKKQPIAHHKPRPTIARQENSSPRLNKAKDRKTVADQANVLVERASRILRESKNQRALPDNTSGQE